MSKRLLRAVVPAFAGLALLAVSAAAQTVVKIGLINSYTGFVAQAADELDARSDRSST